MGRAARKGGGGSGSSDGSRGPVTTDDPRPRPEQDAIVLGVMDECLVYYSPRVDKVLSTPADMEVLVGGSDFDRDQFDGEIAEAESDLLEQVRRNLRETGEIGAASFTRDIDFDVYAGPSHDRLEQRWDSSSATLEAFLSLDEKDTQVWEEDSVAAEQSLLNEFRGPEVDQVRAALDQKAAREEAAIMEEELKRAQRELAEEARIQRHIDDMDDNFTPKDPPQEYLDKEAEEEAQRRAADRAWDDADDQGIDWDSLSASEQRRRIESALETIAEEDLNRAEAQADNWGQ